MNGQIIYHGNTIAGVEQQIVNGYYHENKFFKDEDFTEELSKQKNILYLDLLTDTLYYYNGENYIIIDSKNTTFIGTISEWESLSDDEKANYQLVNITDDELECGVAISNIVAKGDQNPITSEAVYAAINNLYQYSELYGDNRAIRYIDITDIITVNSGSGVYSNKNVNYVKLGFNGTKLCQIQMDIAKYGQIPSVGQTFGYINITFPALDLKECFENSLDTFTEQEKQRIIQDFSLLGNSFPYQSNKTIYYDKIDLFRGEPVSTGTAEALVTQPQVYMSVYNNTANPLVQFSLTQYVLLVISSNAYESSTDYHNIIVK